MTVTNKKKTKEKLCVLFFFYSCVGALLRFNKGLEKDMGDGTPTVSS